MSTVLYNRDSHGRVRLWKIEIDGDQYRTISGLVDGEKVTSGWTTASPKNVGKANETSGEEQARSEAESEVKKKLAQGGYFMTIEEIDNETYFEPMLATGLEKIKGLNRNNVYSQPKLDGVRCVAGPTGLFSRQGKPFQTAGHIAAALDGYRLAFPTHVIDGELYNHDYKDDFNEIISNVRKQKPDQADLDKAAQIIQYHVYDIFIPEQPDMPFSRRTQWLRENLMGVSPLIHLVRTTPIGSVDELDAEYGLYLEQGYEGQMIRIPSSPYENKRTKTLIKRKEFLDDEYTVLDILPGNGNWAGIAKRVHGRFANGTEFHTGIRGNKAYLTKVLAEKDQYIGGSGTVRYQNLTPDGAPRFPVTVALYGGKRDI